MRSQTTPDGEDSGQGWTRIFGTSSALLLSMVFAACSAAVAAEPEFPLKVSADGRYLVDRAGVPFFYHADTAWQITKRLRPAEVEEYLDRRKAQGFNTIHVHTFSKEVTPMTNWEGENPFDPPDDILQPNPKYWRNVDLLIKAAEQRNLLVTMAAIWIRWGGRDQQGWRYQLNESNARGYGEFLGKRYRLFKNLIWILGGDANPIEDSKPIADLAAGIKAHAPHHLITVHNRPEYSSAAFFHTQPWLDINMAYTYAEVYIHVLGEWNRLAPIKPIILGESGYEEESNDGRGGTPWRMRRQAYEAILSGSLGGHAFGHKDIWRMDSKWRSALDSPASKQMAHVKTLFASRPWYTLVPDDSLLTDRGYFGEQNYVTAAVSEKHKFAIAYFPSNRTVTISKEMKGRWFDPVSGKFAEARGKALTPPAKNAGGDPDFILLLEGN